MQDQRVPSDFMPNMAVYLLGHYRYYRHYCYYFPFSLHPCCVLHSHPFHSFSASGGRDLLLSGDSCCTYCIRRPRRIEQHRVCFLHAARKPRSSPQ